MNPSDVMKDAEVVLEYALEKYAHLPDVFPPSDQNRNKQLKVLVHGESLGGMAATYVAMKSNLGRLPVEFAFIDRTFASLDNVAFWTSGISTLKNKVGREDGSARSSLLHSENKVLSNLGQLHISNFQAGDPMER